MRKKLPHRRSWTNSQKRFKHLTFASELKFQPVGLLIAFIPCTICTFEAVFKSGPTPTSFCWFSLFLNAKFTEKTVGFSGIRTQIVAVEGEHADHLTTTTAQLPMKQLHRQLIKLPHYISFVFAGNALSKKTRLLWWLNYQSILSATFYHT